MCHQIIPAAKATRLPPGRGPAVTSPRHDRLSTVTTSRTRRGRFLITCSHAASLSLSFPRPALLWKHLNQTVSCRSGGWFSGRRWRLSMTCCAVFFHHGPVTDCELSAEPDPSDRVGRWRLGTGEKVGVSLRLLSRLRSGSRCAALLRYSPGSSGTSARRRSAGCLPLRPGCR